jgi:hypothetical protein
LRSRATVSFSMELLILFTAKRSFGVRHGCRAFCKIKFKLLSRTFPKIFSELPPPTPRPGEEIASAVPMVFVFCRYLFRNKRSFLCTRSCGNRACSFTCCSEMAVVTARPVSDWIKFRRLNIRKWASSYTSTCQTDQCVQISKSVTSDDVTFDDVIAK